MTTEELTNNCSQQCMQFVQSVQDAVSGLSKEQFNQAMPNGEWSVARVIRHMMLTDEPYLKILPGLVNQAPSGSEEVRHTWFGKQLFKMAGPSGNVSPPKWVVPADVDYDLSLVAEWAEFQMNLQKIFQQAKGKNLNSVKFKNPFLKLFTMNLCDGFAVLTTHTERHADQIVQRAKVAREEK